ncbi:methyltransferase domain-containing protein [Nitrospinaceae bacterium]|nr:methyltransferase domain-containing protein [Nitrospinaceae bacterium]
MNLGKKIFKKEKWGVTYLGVDTQASFMLGSTENIDKLFPDKQFDIVICLGMLHHVASTYDTLSNVSRMSRNVLIVDSMIIPELENDIERIQPVVNTRDIVYQGEENLWSVSAFKYESPYGDGSRKDFGIVNIPSAKLIEMSLNSCGFGPTSTLGRENDFFDETSQKLREVKELLCVAKREMSSSELDLKWKQKASSIEEIFCLKCMPEEIVFSLAKCLAELEESNIYDDLCSLGPDPTSLELKNNVKKIMLNGLDNNLKEYLTTRLRDIDLEHLQVLSVIFRSPHEKSLLEICKFLIKSGQTKPAVEYLKKNYSV